MIEAHLKPIQQQILGKIEEENVDQIATYNDVYKSPLVAPEEYSFGESFMAGFRQYAPAQSIMRLIENTGFTDDEAYDPLKDEQIPKGYEWRFLNSSSAEETSVRLERLDADLKDLDAIENGNLLAVGLGGLVSPLTLAPLGTFKTLSQTSFLKRFVGSAAFTTALYAPEEFLIASQSEGRSELGQTLVPLLGAGLIGGTVGGLFGRRITANTNPADEFAQEGEEGIFRSAGASANLNNPQVLRQSLDNEGLAETGIALEKLKWNPVTRLTASANLTSRKIVSNLVDMGGMIQKKVQGGKVTGEAMDQSVETSFRTTYLSSLLDGIRASDEAYLAFRGVVAKSGDIGRSMQMLSQKGKDFIQRNNTLSEFGFRERVAKAMRNGDADEVIDSATPYVNQAATSYRKHFDKIKANAEEVKLFEIDLAKKIRGLEINVADGVAGATEALATAKARLKQLREQGVLLNTALGYVPRVPRIDKIEKNAERFKGIVSNWAMGHFQYTRQQANEYADEIILNYTKSRPFYNLDEGTDQIDWITNATGAKARSFEIPDKLIEDFLENDIEVLARHHTKTMGVDIELTRKFGDVSMSKIIKQITEEYDALVKQAPTIAEKQKLKQGLANDLRDIRGLRDRVRGTFGASKDPHNMSSRFVRQMKSFNVLVGMGGAAISSIPDIARPIMTEGFKNVYEHGFRHMFKNQRSVIKQMTQKEARQAGIAVDAALGLRANSFSDIGDLFGSRYAMERALNQSTGIFFMMNGLNYWNQAIKEFSSNIISLRMTNAIMRNFQTLNATDRRKLLANGIDGNDAFRMQQLIRQHGQRVDGEWVPNTALWGDKAMVQKFRNALNQSVDRTIITPGAGDRALWTSTEMGSLITQFKGYGQGATVRLLTSGLQEKDSAFWQGAFVLVGLASLVNEFKKKQYGIDKEQSYSELMADAIDRSGILGWFTDVNNSIEKLSDYRLGLRPMMGKSQGYLPFGAKAGAIFGPVASNITTAGSVATDILSGEADDNTLRSARFITPTGNLPYLDPIWDKIMAAK
jgi:hypothetical protein